MKKRSIAIINCFLAVFVFLCIYGNTCYRSAFSGKGGSDFGQQVALCLYFAGSVIISIYCICASPYYTNKCFLVGAIYNILYHILLLFAWIYLLISNHLQSASLNWLHWICIIVPLIISGLYFYAAFNKNKPVTVCQELFEKIQIKKGATTKPKSSNNF